MFRVKDSKLVLNLREQTAPAENSICINGYTLPVFPLRVYYRGFSPTIPHAAEHVRREGEKGESVDAPDPDPSTLHQQLTLLFSSPETCKRWSDRSGTYRHVQVCAVHSPVETTASNHSGCLTWGVDTNYRKHYCIRSYHGWTYRFQLYLPQSNSHRNLTLLELHLVFHSKLHTKHDTGSRKG